MADPLCGRAPQRSIGLPIGNATICALIRPVALDSLSTNQKNIQVRKWIWFGPFVEASLGDRSARRYLLFLMILLALSLVFGFLSSTANNVNLEIQKSVEEANPIAADIRGQIDNLWKKFGNDKSLDDAEDDDTRKKVSQLRNRLQELYYFSSVPASPESQAFIPS